MRKIIIQNYLLSVSTRRVLAEIVETKTKAARLFNIIVELYGKHGDGWVLKDLFLWGSHFKLSLFKNIFLTKWGGKREIWVRGVDKHFFTEAPFP